MATFTLRKKKIVGDGQDHSLALRQQELHNEGERVLADLQIEQLLSELGTVCFVGSYALGLMVWRDIDITVFCDTYDPERCFEALRPLVRHPRVKKLRWDNERGPLHATDWLPDGYYWGVRYWTDERIEWKLDIWVLPRNAEAAKRKEFEAFRAALTPETRRAILRIKDAWRANPDYRSMAVYDAVLTHGARTIEDLHAHLQRRQG